MEKKIIKSSKAPAAIGSYSQGIKAAGLVFVSGQIPIDPETGEVISGDTREQTAMVMKNIAAILAEAGSGLDRIVKTTVYLTNLDDFAEANEVYGNYFEDNPPARTTVEVSRLPKGVAIEIDTIALAG